MRLELDVGLTRSAPSGRQELLHVEPGAPLQHEIGGAAELVGQDGQRLGAAVLASEFLKERLGLGVGAQEEDGGFGPGPLEMGVADLGAAGAEVLAGG